MKSIVVYKTILVSGALILASSLMAQKPAIDLISSHQQYKHPEAIIDTGYAVNPPVRDAVIIQHPAYRKQKQKVESGERKRWQIGPSLDSLFHKEKTETRGQENSPAEVSLIRGKYYPFKILIFIIAIK